MSPFQVALLYRRQHPIDHGHRDLLVFDNSAQALHDTAADQSCRAGLLHRNNLAVQHLQPNGCRQAHRFRQACGRGPQAGGRPRGSEIGVQNQCEIAHDRWRRSAPPLCCRIKVTRKPAKSRRPLGRRLFDNCNWPLPGLSLSGFLFLGGVKKLNRSRRHYGGDRVLVDEL